MSKLTPEQIAAYHAETQAMLCRFENCDGQQHRCTACGGMGYFCHVSHGTRCRFCDGKGTWSCPSMAVKE